MNQSDPLAHADVLAAYGRTKEAADILREAIRHNPSRLELQTRLEELTTKRVLPRYDHIRICGHLAMVWVLILVCGGVVFGTPVSLVKAFESQFEALVARWGMILFLATLLVLVIGLAIAWVYLFLVSWFTYLKALPEETRRKVEDRLPWVLNVVAFGSTYNKVRRLFFHDNVA